MKIPNYLFLFPHKSVSLGSVFGMLQGHSFLRELDFYSKNLRCKSGRIVEGERKS